MFIPCGHGRHCPQSRQWFAPRLKSNVSCSFEVRPRYSSPVLAAVSTSLMFFIPGITVATSCDKTYFKALLTIEYLVFPNRSLSSGSSDNKDSEGLYRQVISCLLYTSPSPRDGLL